MARPLRFVYPGACYHLMARGDGGKMIFIEKEDHLSFLQGLGRVCGSHGWRVHAWVLMGNHFHLLLETPEANLVSGMRLLLGSFGQGWNRRHQRRGHVFQGRYKSIPVTGERASDPFQFRVVADYIHLNPARAGLAGGVNGKLVGYEWTRQGSKLLMKKGSHATAPVKCHGEGEAERMVVRGLEELGLETDAGELIQARKGDPRKVALASVVKEGPHPCEQ